MKCNLTYSSLKTLFSVELINEAILDGITIGYFWRCVTFQVMFLYPSIAGQLDERYEESEIILNPRHGSGNEITVTSGANALF